MIQHHSILRAVSLVLLSAMLAAPSWAGQKEDSGEPEQISVQVAEARLGDNGKLLFVTTNGMVWRQTDGAPARFPKPGSTIVIKDAALSGHWCRLDRWTAVRCQRIDRPAMTGAAEVPPSPPRQAVAANSSPQVSSPSAPASRPMAMQQPAASALSPVADQPENQRGTSQPTAAPRRSESSPMAAAQANASEKASQSGATSVLAQPAAGQTRDRSEPQAAAGERAQTQAPSVDERVENYGLARSEPDDVPRAEVLIATTGLAPNGKLEFVTSDGAAWWQTDGTPVRTLAAGTRLTIVKNALGGHWCRIDRWTAFRCKRAK